LILALSLGGVAAEQPPKEDPEHNEIRAVRDAMLTAFDKGDIDGLLKHVHPEVVVTWQSGETSRGRDGVRKYYERMMVGENRTVQSMTSKLDVDDLSRLYNDKNSAIAAGNMTNHFVLKDGMDFDLASRWTATLLKDQGRWQVTAFHISTNMFDNGVLRLILRKSLLWTGIAAGAAGLLAGSVLGLIVARRRASRTAS
jgi:uncharacterized protein (TIGR02246 family)